MHIEKNVQLAKYTTFKVGGVAAHFVGVKTEGELLDALRYAKQEHLQALVLGGGSNVLLESPEVEGLVIKNEISGIEWLSRNQDNSMVRVGSGEEWDSFVKEVIGQGLWGIENLSGIPGSVGGAPVQNIGAYGMEVKDAIDSVETYHVESLEKRIFSNKECEFSYRESFFKTTEGKKYVITAVVFSLASNGVPVLSYKDLQNKIFDSQFSILNEKEKSKKISGLTPSDIRRMVLEIRAQKFPDLREVGTAGSFFKNPIVPKEQYDALKKQYSDLPGFSIESGIKDQGSRIKIPLAWILENILHKKGYREGDVALFERQPLVVVNYGNATAAEIEAFARSIEQEILEKTGIKINREVNCIG